MLFAFGFKKLGPPGAKALGSLTHCLSEQKKIVARTKAQMT
jgi:hypothetical protein